MPKPTAKSPLCLIIAGPNGAGKTTFAREYLRQDARIVRFVNADLIAAGLSPLDPAAAQVAAGRVLLSEIERHAEDRANFAFETTLSGLTYVRRIERWKKAGYRIEIFFLRLASPTLALKRIRLRVRAGGHDVPKDDVVRRYERGWTNFVSTYRPLADGWEIWDNSGSSPRLVEKHP
jgi:predicted ABC-type ATPase